MISRKSKIRHGFSQVHVLQEGEEFISITTLADKYGDIVVVATTNGVYVVGDGEVSGIEWPDEEVDQ